jgi:hypothetical protein
VTREQRKLATIVAAGCRLLPPDGALRERDTGAPSRHLIADCSRLIFRSGSGRIAQFSRGPHAHPTRPSPTPDERALLVAHPIGPRQAGTTPAYGDGS